MSVTLKFENDSNWQKYTCERLSVSDIAGACRCVNINLITQYKQSILSDKSDEIMKVNQYIDLFSCCLQEISNRIPSQGPVIFSEIEIISASIGSRDFSGNGNDAVNYCHSKTCLKICNGYCTCLSAKTMELVVKTCFKELINRIKNPVDQKHANQQLNDCLIAMKEMNEKFGNCPDDSHHKYDIVAIIIRFANKENSESCFSITCTNGAP